MIVLVGFLGAGKTTVGRGVARRLGRPFLDADQVLVERAGRSIPEIFADDGEAAFRRLEHEVVLDLLGGDDLVLALGGGAVEHPGTREALARLVRSRPGSAVVHLHVSFTEARRRVGSDPNRPLLSRPDLADVHARRLPGFAAAATLEVRTGRRPASAVAREVVERLGLAGEG